MHLTVSSFLTVQLEPENRHMSYVGLPVPKALDRKGLLIQTERFETNQTWSNQTWTKNLGISIFDFGAI